MDWTKWSCSLMTSLCKWRCSKKSCPRISWRRLGNEGFLFSLASSARRDPGVYHAACTAGVPRSLAIAIPNLWLARAGDYSCKRLLVVTKP